ncbi:MAG: RDD family protein [Planctomycetota bacterium]
MKIKCPKCSKVLAIPDAAAGKVVKCPACAQQLRAPGTAPASAPAAPKPAAAPAASKPVAARPAAGRPTTAKPAAARPVTARRPANPSGGGFDAGMFDELTDEDLKPVAGGGVATAYAPPTGNTAKLLQEHAATAGGASGGNFRVGNLASPWNRLAAAIIDGFVIGFIAGPILVVMMIVLGFSLADLSEIENATSEAAKQAAAEALFAKLFGTYLVSVAVAYTVPIILYAWMITASGQTPGKKLCKIRIVTADTKQLPGFAKGVALRSWLKNVLYSIPLLGFLIALADILMIFGEKRQCLHDMIAGTIVVDT